MTPIVFCASLAPWASAMSEPEPICATRKPRFSGPGRLVRNPQYTASMTIAATTSPSSGEISDGRATRLPN